MAGKLWIVNYLKPFAMEKAVERILSNSRPPGSHRLTTALIEATEPQVEKLRQEKEIISLKPISGQLSGGTCIAAVSLGLKCGKPATKIDRLWGGLVCDEHASLPEKSRQTRAANELVERLDQLQREVDQMVEGAERARADGEYVSVLVTELLAGVATHLNSGKEALQLARETLAGAIKGDRKS